MKSNSKVLVLEQDSLFSRYQKLSTSKKFIIAVFMIWLAQALPKWVVAVTADGETSASIMKIFITPKGQSAYPSAIIIPGGNVGSPTTPLRSYSI
jgi:hypothetical protein